MQNKCCSSMFKTHVIADLRSLINVNSKTFNDTIYIKGELKVSKTQIIRNETNI